MDEDGDLNPVGGGELGEPAGHVGFDGSFAHVQGGGDFGVGGAGLDSGGNFTFAVGERAEVAATVGNSWVFRRLAEELARSRWNGVAPWEALHTLADQLGLTELDDVADILRLSGEEGAAVFEQLRARSAGMRSALLHELARANEINERLSILMSLLGVIFLALLVAPALLRLVFGAAP